MAPQDDVINEDPLSEASPEANGASRFSEEDMDTEIEFDENGEEKPRKKKRKGAHGDQNDSENKHDNTKNERSSPPPYAEKSDDDVRNPKKKKQTVKSKMKHLLDEPLYFTAGVLVCVILPFGIYACDVVISVNVIDGDSYKNAVISPNNDFTEIPTPIEIVGEKYHGLKTILHTIQFNAKNSRDSLARYRMSRDVSNQEPNIIDAKSTDQPESTESQSSSTILTSSDSKTSTQKSADAPVTDESIVISPKLIPPTLKPSKNATTEKNIVLNSTTLETKTKNATKKPLRFKPRPVKILTTLVPVTISKRPERTKFNASDFFQQEGEFCRGLHYFYTLHINYYNETEGDWYDDQISTAYQKEQTMFFMFTIIGFISLLIGLGLRCDVFLSDEWSSFILINLFLYSISMAVTVLIFAQESGEAGLRCATCRFTSYCDDIDPWNYTSHWPSEEAAVQWSMVALLSFILKLIDCYAIAIVTLKFIVDVAEDYWWVTCLKVFGWLFVFPLLIFTPMLGVTRYVALPAVVPDDYISQLVTEVIFYVGVVFWGLFIIALPIFCKMRMWSGSEEEERQEDEEMYE